MKKSIVEKMKAVVKWTVQKTGPKNKGRKTWPNI